MTSTILRHLALGLCLATALTGAASAQAGLQYLRESPRPALASRDPGAVYLEDFLAAEQRVFLELVADAPIYRTSAATHALDTARAGFAVELLAFTQHGFFVRVPQGLGGDLMLGWVGRHSIAGPEEEFLDALVQLEQRRRLVEALIAENEVALGMTPGEVVRSLGEADEQRLRETSEGTSGLMSWVETRQVPVYRLVRDSYTGQLFRQIVGYETIEERRVDIEFENGTANAIERSLDNRHNREIPSVSPPLTIPAW